jgi:hypothetical protein
MCKSLIIKQAYPALVRLAGNWHVPVDSKYYVAKVIPCPISPILNLFLCAVE